MAQQAMRTCSNFCGTPEPRDVDAQLRFELSANPKSDPNQGFARGQRWVQIAWILLLAHCSLDTQRNIGLSSHYTHDATLFKSHYSRISFVWSASWSVYLHFDCVCNFGVDRSGSSTGSSLNTN